MNTLTLHIFIGVMMFCFGYAAGNAKQFNIWKFLLMVIVISMITGQFAERGELTTAVMLTSFILGMLIPNIPGLSSLGDKLIELIHHIRYKQAHEAIRQKEKEIDELRRQLEAERRKNKGREQGQGKSQATGQTKGKSRNTSSNNNKRRSSSNNRKSSSHQQAREKRQRETKAHREREQKQQSGKGSNTSSNTSNKANGGGNKQSQQQQRRRSQQSANSSTQNKRTGSQSRSTAGSQQRKATSGQQKTTTGQSKQQQTKQPTTNPFHAARANALKLLELDPNQTYTFPDVKKAYRRVSSKCHPDKFQNEPQSVIDAMTAKFQEVQKAYEYLAKYL